MPVDVAISRDVAVPRTGLPRAVPIALGVSAAAAAVLPDGPWVLLAVAAQVGASAATVGVLTAPRRALVAVSVLLAAPPTVALVLDISGSSAARAASVLCGAWFLVALRLAPARGGPTTRQRLAGDRWPIPVVAGLGAAVVINSYLLWGPSGVLSLMEHQHVLHAAALGSALAAGSELATWVAQTAVAIRAQSGALPLAYSAWVDRASAGSPSVAGPDLLVIVAVVCALSFVLAWLSLVAATSTAARSLATRRAGIWAGVGLLAALVGPVLWLRVHGLWPQAVSAGMMALAGVSMVGLRQVQPAHEDRELATAATWMAVPLVALACLSWPVMGLPATGALVVGWVVLPGIRPAGRSGVMAGALLLGSVLLGAGWVARTGEGPGAFLGAPSGLGLPDWRLVVVAALLARALVALPERGRPGPMPQQVAATAVVSGMLVACGVVLDYLLSVVQGRDATALAGLMGILGLAIGLASLVAWLAGGDLPGARWSARSWRTVATLVALAGTAVWVPWGGADWSAGTVGVAQAAPTWARAGVGTQVVAGRRAVQDHPILRCGWDGLIAWPAESPRTGAVATTAAWAAVMAARTDEAGWGATRYVYPQFDSRATADDQFGWLRSVGPSDVPRRLLWVLPDDPALAVAARQPSEAVPAGITLRVVGEERFRDEVAQCVDGGGPA